MGMIMDENNYKMCNEDVISCKCQGCEIVANALVTFWGISSMVFDGWFNDGCQVP
jgi:hypothetical protein